MITYTSPLLHRRRRSHLLSDYSLLSRTLRSSSIGKTSPSRSTHFPPICQQHLRLDWQHVCPQLAYWKPSTFQDLGQKPSFSYHWLSTSSSMEPHLLNRQSGQLCFQRSLSPWTNGSQVVVEWTWLAYTINIWLATAVSHSSWGIFWWDSIDLSSRSYKTGYFSYSYYSCQSSLNLQPFERDHCMDLPIHSELLQPERSQRRAFPSHHWRAFQGWQLLDIMFPKGPFLSQDWVSQPELYCSRIQCSLHTPSICGFLRCGSS